MTAETLNEMYHAELTQLSAGGAHVPRAIDHMIAETERRKPARLGPDEAAWLWSDLHLHHRNIIRYTKRPFASRDEMDEALLAAWRETVGEGETVICGGDMALAGTLTGRRLAAVRNAPGRKVLILGNHDFTKRGRVAPTGCHVHWMTALVETDPPLALTHLPLSEVPRGVVNVHGHVHNNEPLRPGRHINICVEHTGYRPLGLSGVVRLARALAAGRQVEGETTLARIERVGGGSES